MSLQKYQEILFSRDPWPAECTWKAVKGSGSGIFSDYRTGKILKDLLRVWGVQSTHQTPSFIYLQICFEWRQAVQQKSDGEPLWRATRDVTLLQHTSTGCDRDVISVSESLSTLTKQPPIKGCLSLHKIIIYNTIKYIRIMFHI